MQLLIQVKLTWFVRCYNSPHKTYITLFLTLLPHDTHSNQTKMWQMSNGDIPHQFDIVDMPVQKFDSLVFWIGLVSYVDSYL
jgi:hypothetical protein